MTDDYYYMPEAKLEYKSGSAISTDMLNNGATLGVTSFCVADVCIRISCKNQVKTRTRTKKSGFSGYRIQEGGLKPAEFSISLQANSAVPLSWVHASDNADDAAGERDDHVFSIPTQQQPHISGTATTSIPALGLRFERESGTNANQRIDLLGCVVTELKLSAEDGDKFTWEVKGLCMMVLAGVTTITSHASDPTTTRFGWEHLAITFTYNSTAVAITPTALTITWRLDWQPVAPGYKATTYFVYTNALLKSWDVEVELKGRPYEDGSKVSVYTVARTAPSAYAGALLFTCALTRTTTSDVISYSIDKTVLELDEIGNSDRESSDYEEVTATLNTAEGFAITATASDLLEKAYYGGAT